MDNAPAKYYLPKEGKNYYYFIPRMIFLENVTLRKFHAATIEWLLDLFHLLSSLFSVSSNQIFSNVLLIFQKIAILYQKIYENYGQH
jgi:hypothetical protein